MERTLPAGRLGGRRSRRLRVRIPVPAPLRGAARFAFGVLALVGRGCTAVVVLGRRHPRWVAALAAVLAVLGVAYLVVRESSLSAVRRVEVRGVSGMDAGAIESALVAAGQRQSTLGVNVGALRAAVAPYHLVSALHVSASFPHTLRITVDEQLPVATLRAASQTVVVAADGTVLDPSVAAGAAPTIDVPVLPGARVTDPQLLSELTILGAAPPVMLHRVARVYPSPNGLTVSMRNGLVIFFGDAARPHAKWLSAARVIASPLAAGATYVDVRVPDHPAAGGLSVASPASDTGLSTDPADASIAAALAAALTNSGAAASTTGAAATTTSPAGAATVPAADPAATPSPAGAATTPGADATATTAPAGAATTPGAGAATTSAAGTAAPSAAGTTAAPSGAPGVSSGGASTAGDGTSASGYTSTGG